MKFIYSMIGFMSLIVWSTELQAGTVSQVYGTTLTKQTQTAFVRAEAGWTTYESQAAQSNATVPTTAAESESLLEKNDGWV